jgi:hypothetical protein
VGGITVILAARNLKNEETKSHMLLLSVRVHPLTADRYSDTTTGR